MLPDPDDVFSAADTFSAPFDAAAYSARNTPVPPGEPHPPSRDSEANDRLDQLLLICSAMWELLSEKTALTHDDLLTRIAEIDARDGTADGKLTYAPTPCPQCHRTLFPRQTRCLYCGAPRPLDNIFKTI